MRISEDVQVGGDNGANNTIQRSTAAVRSGPPIDILIDQGDADNFLHAGQLQPQAFVQACRDASVPCALRMRHRYDHSYYFIATFIGDHIAHHARYLKLAEE